MSEQTANSEIIISPKAVAQAKKIMQENDIPETYSLRVSVKGGGCSGFTYHLGFDEEAKSTDTKFEQDGLSILVDGKSLFYLMGCELDFSDDLNGKEFEFKNPNAKNTCGCGDSCSI